jgi:arylsulfatase A-like enzyme
MARSRRDALRLGAATASVGALGALGLAGVTAETRGPAGQPATPPPPVVPGHHNPPNILLITLDTVRADQLHVYGHPTMQTPALDALAGQGARFDLHMIQQPQTNPSHGSIFTGMYPSSSGVLVHMVDKVPAKVDTLAAAFARAGFQTAALYSWMSFDPQYCGFNRGFRTYRNVAPGSPTALSHGLLAQAAAEYRVAGEYLTLPKVITEVTGVQQRLEETAKGRADLTTDAAIAQLDELSGAPFFLWVHYFDPHYPYEPPEALATRYDADYRGSLDASMNTVKAIENGKLLPQGGDLQWLVSLYQAEITFLDHHLGRLFAALDARGLADNTVVALTSDHGEAFGEHLDESIGPDFFHPHSLFNTEQRTPLLLRYPPRIQPGTVVGAPAQALDLFPTLLELAGVPVPEQAEGQSLVGLLDGTDDGSSRAAFSAMADGSLTSATVPGWKYIRNNLTGGRQLYDLNADLGETHDLSDTYPDLASSLADKTETWMKAVNI